MSIQIRLADTLGEAGGVYRYRLCGVEVSCDVSLPSLLPFAIDQRRPGGMDPQAEPGLVSPGVARYETTGVTGGRERRVVLETRPEGVLIEIEEFGRYALNADGSVISLERLTGPASPATVEDCTLGAPLILALALRGCWFLHAAAVVVAGRAAAIAGPSGSGKSTMAARLDQERACLRIADDLLGVRWDDPSVSALADYPQLKLPAVRQHRQPPVELDTIYLLRAAVDGGRFAVRTVEKSEKLLALARHSVASTLFPAVVLEQHLAFCRAAAGSVRVVEIAYPHNGQALERAVGLILMPGSAADR